MRLAVCGVRAFVVALLCLWAVVHADDDDHDHGSTLKSEAHQYVTCGSLIKLRHESTAVRLHSHEVTYGSGSGQQSVTGQPLTEDDNSYWLVREPLGGTPCLTGDRLKRGDSFRLQHLSTGRFLHSHLHQSPLSRQQEVSAFGESGRGDRGDNWLIVPSGKEVYWLRGERVKVQHKDTSLYLDISDQSFKNPIPGQREVVCNTKTQITEQGSRAAWIADEGLFMPFNK